MASKNTKKKRKWKFKFKPNRSLVEAIIWILIIGIVSFIFLDKLFTLIMVGGIIAIALLSMLINKMRKKKGLRIAINVITVIILLVCIAGVGGVTWFFKYVVDNAPEFDTKLLYKSQTSIIYDNKNEIVAEMGTEKREIITYNQMNETLIDSIIATEDSKFFVHNGFDPVRFLKASVLQVLGNPDAGGASTLTMQIAKNNYTSTEDEGFEGIVRKFTDIYMSIFKIEKEFSKQEILEFYVNIHFLGSNSSGVEEASKTYFGKSAKDLNLSEAALLAGLFKSPSAFNPFRYPEKAEERRSTVLYLMERHGYITHEEREIANSIPVESLLVANKDEQLYLAYINEVVDEAKKKYGVNPNTTSVKIYTNLDSKKQQKLDDIFSGKSYKWENPEVQAGVAAVDVWTGKIIAIGGGRNTEVQGFSFASDSNRQIGSTAKPIFDYAPGMEYNNWSTYQIFDDSKYYYSSGQEIRNSDREYMGEITLRTALAQSRNIPALKAFQQLDNKKVYEFITKLGIIPEAEARKTKYLHEAYSIGAFNGSNPLTMAAAYAAFANGGYYIEPYTINKIVFRDTNEVITHEIEKVKVMSDSTAFMITDVLKTAVTNGLSSVAKVKGVNVAAKTGTTNYTEEILKANGLPNEAINDAWVIGYDPDISIGLWYGYEPINKKYYTTVLSASVQRKKLFNAIGTIMFDKDGKDFKVPNSVVKLPIEMGTNPAKLASEYTPDDKITYEYFKVGTEPTEVSQAYMKLENIKDLNVNYDPSTLNVNLSWTAATKPETVDKDFGDFGYKIYKDYTYLGFTKDTYYTISNEAYPNATYKVVTCFKKYDKNCSSGITYTLTYVDPSNYRVELNLPETTIYYIGDNLNNFDLNPSKQDIKMFKDSTDVTSNSTVGISIKDNNGNNIANITTTEKKEYTITYTVTYNGHTNTVSRKIIVNEKSTNTPQEGDSSTQGTTERRR